MKTILVPTDFSPHADYALNAAAQLAKKHHAELILVHLLELPLNLIDPLNEGIGGDLPESMFFMELAHKKMNETLDQFKYQLKGINIKHMIEFDQTSNGIISKAKDVHCDLIIMGSNGADGLEELFIGSNTEKIVRHADMPVLVVKDDFELSQVKSFAFISNLKSDNKTAFKSALEFAKLLDLEVHLVYFNTPNSFKTTYDIEALLGEFTSDIKNNWGQFHIYNALTLEEGISHFGSKIEVDLLGIGTHGRQGISRLINSSKAESVVNHLKKPILTFKIKA